MRRLAALAAAVLFAGKALAAASFDHFSGTSAPPGWTFVTSSTGVGCMNGTIVAATISKTTSAIYWVAARASVSTLHVALVDEATPAGDTNANIFGAQHSIENLSLVNGPLRAPPAFFGPY